MSLLCWQCHCVGSFEKKESDPEVCVCGVGRFLEVTGNSQVRTIIPSVPSWYLLRMLFTHGTT
jgi:hypothetical protein